MSGCDTSKQACDTPAVHEDCCAVEKSISQVCCPADQAAQMWNKAFFGALKEAQVDILKEKIRKQWGPMMEKEGDAVIAAMGTHWQSMLAQAKAQKDLRDTIQKIFESAK